jgi:hypothetical protein
MNAFSASVKGPRLGRAIRVETGVLAEAGRSDEGDSVAIVEQTYVTVTSRSVIKRGTGGTKQIQGAILRALQKNATVENWPNRRRVSSWPLF